MNNITVSAIAAMSRNGVIGKNNQLLWHIPADMKRFKELTVGHTVIMGRKTWESIPKKFRPLPDRKNIVITREKDYRADGAVVVSSPEEALELVATTNEREVFVIGGQQIYEALLPYTSRLYLTLIDKDFEGDTFFPDYSKFSKELSREKSSTGDLAFEWLTLER